MAFVKYISDDELSFHLEMGSEEKIIVSNEPMRFCGKRSYVNPSENNLDDESELADINDYEDEIEEADEFEEIE